MTKKKYSNQHYFWGGNYIIFKKMFEKRQTGFYDNTVSDFGSFF